MADVSQIKLPNGSVYDLIDEKSGYITADYIENKTDYEIPVSRVGEIVVGETAIGTDSTNFPTSKAVVDYVDERVVQEIDAIDVGVTGIKANGTSLAVENGVVNIPIVGPNQAVGLMTDEYMTNIFESIPTYTTQLENDSGFITASDIPTSTSQLTNDSGFITASDIPTPDLSSYMQKGVDYVTAGKRSGTTLGNYATAEGYNTTASNTAAHAEGRVTQATGISSHSEGYNTIASKEATHAEGYSTTASNNYSHAEGFETTASGIVSHAQGEYTTASGNYSHAEGSHTIAQRKSQHVFGEYNIADTGGIDTGYRGVYVEIVGKGTSENSRSNARTLDWSGNEVLAGKLTVGAGPTANMDVATKQYVDNAIPSIPTNISSFTNDSGYLTSSDIASVLTYKGTKASYSALPSSGNSTGDVWHITDTGAEYAWDGSTWQELGTAIDLSNYATKATTLAGYGITDAKIQNGTITLGSNSITPLTSYTETDPTVPSWAKASTKPTYTASEVGALPDTTTIPSKTSDLTNDSGFITSYTDEKLKTTIISATGSENFFVLTSNTDNSENKNRSTSALRYSLTSANKSNLFIGSNGILGQIYLHHGGNNTYYATLSVGTLTASRTIQLPDKTGTVALTSDIPDTSSFLTSETDPVFSASAAAGIGSSDITNWNGKIDNQYIGYLDNHNLYIPKEWTYYRGTSRFSYYVPFYVKGTNTSTISSTSKVRTIGTTTDLFSFGTIFIDNVRQSGTVTLEENKLYMYHLSDGDTIIYTVANLSDIPDTSSFLTSETDPVFSASAAAGISATDISNWNAKVSDTGKWNGVELANFETATANDYYVPAKTTVGSTSGTASWLKVTRTPGNYSIAQYDNGYLKSTTPSANDNSTKVATTAYVDAAIPKVYSSTNTGGYLTMATLPIYDGTVE